MNCHELMWRDKPMKCYEVMERLEELSPPMYAEDWDNVGLLV